MLGINGNAMPGWAPLRMKMSGLTPAFWRSTVYLLGRRVVFLIGKSVMETDLADV